MKYDFAGWATRYNMKCSDGRTIKNDAFKHHDKTTVPLVWNHVYDTPDNVIGHATLKHCEEGVYAYCEFNENDAAVSAKNLVVHGDITSLSIYANKLRQKGNEVYHGQIREVSLVLAGANPGASIQEVMVHGDEDEMTATIYNDCSGLELQHADNQNEPEKKDEDNKDNESKENNEDNEDETIADIYNAMSEKQKKAVAAMIAQLADDEEDDNEDNKEDDSNMKHNVFDQNNNEMGEEMKHSEILSAALSDAKKYGSLKESIIQHAGTYGINDIEELFPEEHNVSNEPQFIDRDQSWVAEFINATKKSPFSRLKAIYADITAEQARAKGYTKGKKKIEEVFGLLKRTTSPTTIYKKQKLDRDDIIDISTNFDVVAWMKREMRGKLNEEIARAILLGDGRSSLAEDKIKEANIRPIVSDDDLYTIKAVVSTGAEPAKEFIKACIKARVDYEGDGVPNLYIAPEMLADMLLLEDVNGRFIYPDVASLAKVLRVNKIVEVPLLKNFKREYNVDDGKQHFVKGIIVNPNDYTIGADKLGQVAMFEDFDIDFNQMKYLMETRMSGSLLKPKTAITVEEVTA